MGLNRNNVRVMTGLNQLRVAPNGGTREDGNELSGSVGDVFIDQFTDCWFLENGVVPWNAYDAKLIELACDRTS